MKTLPALCCLVVLFLANPVQTTVAGDAPGFTLHPQSVMVPVGETLRLSCLATGTPPIFYRWQNGANLLLTQTNAMLTITNAQIADAGSYAAVAYNDDGTNVSQVAAVIVHTNHVCDFPPSWVAFYRGAEPGYGNSILARANALTIDPSGCLYVTGDSATTNSLAFRATTIKFDRAGQQMWVAKYRLGINNSARGNAIALDAQGNVLVAGDTSAGGPQVYAVVKYAPDGTELWANLFTNSCGAAGGVPYAISADEGGNVYVSGSRGVVKYSPGGAFLWATCEQYNRVLLHVLTNGLGYLLTGKTTGSGEDLIMARYDTNGSPLWVTNLNFGVGSTDEDLNGNGIAVDGSNNLFAAVSSTVPGDLQSADIVAVKFALDGTHQWTRRFGATNRAERAADFSTDKTGNLIVVGDSWTSPTAPASQSDYSGFDILVLKYGPDGSLLWTANYGGFPGNEDRANSVAVDRDGNIYVMGVSHATNNEGVWPQSVILKYSPDGTLLWRMRRTDYPWFLATDAAGDAFATGTRNFYPFPGLGPFTELLAMKLGQNEPRLAVCTGLQADGWFHGSLVSPRWTGFELLAKTDLITTNWQTIGAVTNFNGLAPFYDPDAGQHPMRFYRGKQQAP